MRIKKFFLKKLTQFNYIYEVCKNQNFDIKSPKINLGRIQATLNSAKTKIENLSEVEFQVFSQFGDDGIIQYLIDKLPIKNKTFIEFGVENYKESNTRFLLVNNYWAGMIIDGDLANINQIKNSQLYSFYDLKAIHSFITKDNINELIKSSGLNKEVGILSIDIDGNDYWVWKEIQEIEPQIIICEYNSLFGFEESVTIPYQSDFVRGKSTPFNFYGTSLKAAHLLATERGYFFIGCNSAGNNAYFINNNLKSFCPVSEKSLEDGFNFAMFSEAWDQMKEPKRGKEKILHIDGLEVQEVLTLQKKKFNADETIASLNKKFKFRGIQ